jgi:phosphoenolpyruvate carboxykinase (ATP)
MLSALKIASQHEQSNNLGTAALVENALKNEGALLSNTGALVVKTGKKTGRSPEHKFVVKEETTQDKIWWDNNKPISEEAFDKLKAKVLNYLSTIQYYTQDLKVGADSNYSLKVRVINEFAWHSLFARTMFCAHDVYST